MVLSIDLTKVKKRLIGVKEYFKSFSLDIKELDIMILLSLFITGAAIGKHFIIYKQFFFIGFLIFVILVNYMTVIVYTSKSMNKLFIARGIFILLLATVIGNYI